MWQYDTSQILNLKIVGQYLPKILSEYIEAPHLARTNDCIYITNRNKSLDNIESVDNLGRSNGR